MCGVNARTTSHPTAKRRSRYEGIVLRHARSCSSRVGGGCSCSPSHQAQVWSAREQKTRKTFATLREARSWRHESQVALRAGTLRSSSHLTLEQAAAAWLLAAEARIVRTRTGEAYKPSAVRAYRQALRFRVYPSLGSKRLTAVTHTMLQDFADQLSAHGLSPSSVRNTILPLRAIFRRAHRRNDVAINPTLKLTLPPLRGQRDRIAAPTEIAPLLNALEPDDRAIYATAIYAGLRAGELQALQWDDIDLPNNLIHITKSWDRQTGFVQPKSRSGNRRVPITPTLRRELINHRLHQGKGGQGFAFPNKTATGPFNPAPSNYTPPKLGKASPRSASTNAATATPPT